MVAILARRHVVPPLKCLPMVALAAELALLHELVDLDTGNLVGSYRTLDESLAVIRGAYLLRRWASINDLGLMRVRADGSQELVVVGPELARQAIAEEGSVGLLRQERTA